MDNKHVQSFLETRLAEFWALNELEALARQRDMVDQEHSKALQALRQSIAPEYSDTAISATRAHMLRQIDTDIAAHDLSHSTIALLDEHSSSATGKLWEGFQYHLMMIEEANEQHLKALETAKDRINPAQFWAQVAQADSWIDLKLPREDIMLRASVNRLNECRTAAFEFYHKENSKLRIHHQKRLALVNELLGRPNEAGFSPGTSEYNAEQSEISVGSPNADLESIDDIRGPFNPIEYINFMNEGKKGLPILGSDLSSLSGKVARQTLGISQDPQSPSLPLFTDVTPESGISILDAMKCAFKLEENSLNRNIYDAVCSVTDPDEGEKRIDRGWLLGLVLANLPRPLIYLNEERIQAFRNSLPRDQITFILQKGTQEYIFFKDLWRHTTDVNIQLAASAITQVKGAERIMSDIRSKWHIELDMPLPARRKWSASEDASSTVPSHGSKN